jgi:hypothetical protein
MKITATYCQPHASWSLDLTPCSALSRSVCFVIAVRTLESTKSRQPDGVPARKSFPPVHSADLDRTPGKALYVSGNEISKAFWITLGSDELVAFPYSLASVIV